MTRRALALVCLGALLVAALAGLSPLPGEPGCGLPAWTVAPPAVFGIGVVPAGGPPTASPDLVRLPWRRGPPILPVPVETISMTTNREGPWDLAEDGFPSC